MTETLIDRIVEEVLVRIDQKDVSEKKALLLYTGGTMGRTAGIRVAENLKRGGWTTETVVTEAARQIGTLDFLPKGVEALDSNFGSAKLLAMEHHRILVPVMTITTASKIAKMIWDTPAAYLIGSALSQGKEVWAAKDACDFSLREKAPMAMKEMSHRVIHTLESFGIRWCKSDELYRDLIFAKAASLEQAYIPAQPECTKTLPELCRIARIDKRVITRGDVIPYLSGIEQIQIPRGTILTALADEELKKTPNPMGLGGWRDTMILAKVIGNVVATTKDDRLVGEKLLILTPLTPEGDPKGETIVAIDSLGAGNGEIVLACRGGAARLVANHEGAPVDYAIVAIVDEVKVYGR